MRRHAGCRQTIRVKTRPGRNCNQLRSSTLQEGREFPPLLCSSGCSGSAQGSHGQVPIAQPPSQLALETTYRIEILRCSRILVTG